MTRTVAIVPMRHDSERVKGKNYRILAGRPLFHHVVESLLSVTEIDSVVIDTDSETILADAAANFPEVVLLRRPAYLRAGDIPMNDVLLNILSQVEADIVLQTHSTNPFLKSATIAKALQTLALAGDEFDSVFSVTRFQNRLWDEQVRPVNHDPGVLLRTQDLSPLYIENSCFFVFTPALLRERGTRIGARPKMIEMSPIEAIDIDTEDDWMIASAIADSGIAAR